jgi:hypothetical protein
MQYLIDSVTIQILIVRSEMLTNHFVLLSFINMNIGPHLQKPRHIVDNVHDSPHLQKPCHIVDNVNDAEGHGEGDRYTEQRVQRNFGQWGQLAIPILLQEEADDPRKHDQRSEPRQVLFAWGGGWGD